MARKKQQTYNDMVRAMEEAQKKVISKRDHIADVIGDELDYITAAILGDLSDTELRRVARLMFSKARMFVNLAELNTLKQQFQDAEGAAMVDGEIRYNRDKNCWEIWDTEANKQVGLLQDGMYVEFFNDFVSGGDWTPAKVHMGISDSWCFAVERNDPSNEAGIEFMLGGMRVRYHKANRA